MDLGTFLQFLAAGLTVGSTYGLAALGFTIIFNTTGIINFAQGEFVMLGGLLAVVFMHWLDPGLPAAVILAVLATTVVGLIMERLTIRPVQHTSVINLIIVTIGVSITIRGLMMLLWGKDTYVLPAFSGTTPIPLLGATIAPQSLWILGITLLVLAAMRYFFSRTIFGRAMLACSFEPRAARLMGISVERMVMASFMLSAFVGAVGGAILTPLTMTSYDVGVLLGLKGFAACILGGLGNPFGAAAGGLLLGVLEAFGAGLISSAYKDAIAFVVILAILLWRPSGLFGAPDTERV